MKSGRKALTVAQQYVNLRGNPVSFGEGNLRGGRLVWRYEASPLPLSRPFASGKFGKRSGGHGWVIGHAAINDSSCSRIRPRLFNKCYVTFRIMRAQCRIDTPRNCAPLLYCKRCHRKSPDLRVEPEQNSSPLSRIRHFLAPFAAGRFWQVRRTQRNLSPSRPASRLDDAWRGCGDPFRVVPVGMPLQFD
jgi:hypothetical protein